MLAPTLSTNNTMVRETPLRKKPSTTQILIFTSLHRSHLLQYLMLPRCNFTAPGTDHLEPLEENAPVLLFEQGLQEPKEPSPG